MARRELYINSLIISARYDLKKGIPKDVVLRSLSRVIDRDLFNEVLKKL